MTALIDIMTKESKIICLIIPSLQSGGMERVMNEIAWYIEDNTKDEVHIILYSINRTIFYHLPDNVILHTPPFEFNAKFRLFSSIKTLLFLRKKLRSLSPDVILSFGELWNSFVLIAIYRLKIPVIISDRCQPDKKFSFFHESLRKLLYPGANGIIVQTAYAKKEYQQKFKHPNIISIGNPIRDIPNVNGISKDNIVLSVGRLIDTKHHDQLIDIFLRINKPGWKLVIVGDDAIKQNNMMRLQRLIVQHNAADRIILAGKQRDVESYYLKSKIFAFTSSSEGFPNVIGEAMSAGLPVVAYDCIAGPSELIEDGENGFLIPLFDKETFIKRLGELMDDENLRISMGNRAREIVKKFDVNSIGNKYYTSLKSVM